MANVEDDGAAVATGALVYSLHDLMDVAPTAEEQILAEPREYARMAKTLLLISDELALVDPYSEPAQEENSARPAGAFKICGKR